MNSKNIITCFIATVWIINGLFCKVLNFVPRHQLIVARILGSGQATLLTNLIGIAEILMAVWILSKVKPRLNVTAQLVLIATMNILEVIFASDLLLWGRANLIFAFLFMLLIYYNGFVINKKNVRSQDLSGKNQVLSDI